MCVRWRGAQISIILTAHVLQPTFEHVAGCGISLTRSRFNQLDRLKCRARSRYEAVILLKGEGTFGSIWFAVNFALCFGTCSSVLPGSWQFWGLIWRKTTCWPGKERTSQTVRQSRPRPKSKTSFQKSIFRHTSLYVHRKLSALICIHLTQKKSTQSHPATQSSCNDPISHCLHDIIKYLMW